MDKAKGKVRNIYINYDYSLMLLLRMCCDIVATSVNKHKRTYCDTIITTTGKVSINKTKQYYGGK